MQQLSQSTGDQNVLSPENADNNGPAKPENDSLSPSEVQSKVILENEQDTCETNQGQPSTSTFGGDQTLKAISRQLLVARTQNILLKHYLLTCTSNGSSIKPTKRVSSVCRNQTFHGFDTSNKPAGLQDEIKQNQQGEPLALSDILTQEATISGVDCIVAEAAVTGDIKATESATTTETSESEAYENLLKSLKTVYELGKIELFILFNSTYYMVYFVNFDIIYSNND